MKKRMVAAFLVGVMILSPGCYYTTEAYERRMPHSRRIVEERRPWGKELRGIGGGVAALGGALLIFPLFATMGASEEEQEEMDPLLYGGLGLVALGGLIWCGGAAVNHQDSRRTEFRIAPNGCLLTCRF